MRLQLIHVYVSMVLMMLMNPSWTNEYEGACIKCSMPASNAATGFHQY